MSANSNEESQEQFWIKLEKDLDETNQWPAPYYYKFILPTNEDSLETLIAIFEPFESEFSTRESSSKKYTSVTITVKHNNAKEIIGCYRLAVLIDGIKSL
jgi:uncharacterized protein